METIRIEATEPVIGMYIGWINLNVHDEGSCAGQACCIHHPSEHHMVDWPKLWRGDLRRMERVCPIHKIGHPDPDDLNPDSTHTCCGCCVPGGWGNAK